MFFMMWIYTGTNTSESENGPCQWSSYPSSTSPSSTVTVHSDTGSLRRRGPLCTLCTCPLWQTLTASPFTMSFPHLPHTPPLPQRSGHTGPALSGSLHYPRRRRLRNESAALHWCSPTDSVHPSKQLPTIVTPPLGPGSVHPASMPCLYVSFRPRTLARLILCICIGC